MLQIKKNINLKFGIAFFIIASFLFFLNNNLKKAKTRDISNFVVTVERGSLSETINSSGEIKATKSINIGPKKQGFIKSINVKEGDYVLKDQIIASLDDIDFVYKLEELKLLADRQQSEFLRRKFLYKEGAISKENFEEYKIKSKTSEAKLKDALAEKSFYQIKAPFSGIITGKYAEIGSFVAPSSNINSDNTIKNFLFELSNGKEIIAKVPESDIGRIKIGQEALVRIEAYPSNKYTAKVVKIAPRALKDNNVTSFQVTLKFKRNYEEIKIGMTADLEFKVKNNEQKLLVPTVSIVTQKGKKGILKVDSNNYPIFKEIEIGVSSGSKTSVLEGVKQGEKIFIDVPPWTKKRK